MLSAQIQTESVIKSSVHHRCIFLAYTNEEAGEIDIRVYIGEMMKPLHDVRAKQYDALHLSDDWKPAQAFGQQMKTKNSWGIVYRSVRDSAGECIAALRPPAVSIPRQGSHYSYVWGGERIISVYQKELKMTF